MEFVKKIILFCIVFAAGLGLSFIFSNKPTSPKNIRTPEVSRQLIDDAYRKNSSVQKIDGAVAAVVNHHLLAPDLIAGTLQAAATNNPITVILVSPNHFTRGTGRVISSRFDWQTPYGLLQADHNAIGVLEKSGLINVDETPFAEEHGIYNIIPFIKKSFPNAKIVPLILKNNLPDDQVDLLAQKITEILNTLVVFSFDFSHYQTKSVADTHDIETINTIYTYDFKNIKYLDVDSRPGVRLMIKYSKLKNTSFSILYHSNSADYVKNLAETTSYIDGVFTQAK